MEGQHIGRRLLTGLKIARGWLRRFQLTDRGGGSAPRAHPWEASYPPGIEWSLKLEPRPLFTVLDDGIAKYPHRPCMQFRGRRFSYHEVGDLVARAAKGFQDIGVRKGVQVGLFLPNSPYYVICYYAILKSGGTVVNFNPLYAEPEVASQIRDSNTRVMVTLDLKGLYPQVARRLDDTCLEKIVVCRLSRALRFPEKAFFALLGYKETAAIPADERHIWFERLISNKGEFVAREIDPIHDVAVLQYTGGTTGRPKGAQLTHYNLFANTTQTRIWATTVKPGKEKVLAVLPLFHVFGMTGVMNLGLAIGAEIILFPRFKVAEFLRLIHRERPTILMGVPTVFSAINEHRDRHAVDLSSLRFCISGGAPLTSEVKRAFEGLAGCTLLEGYGLTEAGPVCTMNPLTGPARPGSVGLPLPGTTIEIRSLENPRKSVPPGTRGEVCIQGPQVMAGYWNQDEETRGVLHNGLLRSGDVGFMDTEGYLFIIDRLKDLIITSGFNVYPSVVEEAIGSHPAVQEAAVCGIPHSHRGEVVKAYVVLREGAQLTPVALRSFLKERLAPFELPRDIEFRKELPKTPLGKPSRRELVAAETVRLERQKAGPTEG